VRASGEGGKGNLSKLEKGATLLSTSLEKRFHFSEERRKGGGVKALPKYTTGRGGEGVYLFFLEVQKRGRPSFPGGQEKRRGNQAIFKRHKEGGYSLLIHTSKGEGGGEGTPDPLL